MIDVDIVGQRDILDVDAISSMSHKSPWDSDEKQGDHQLLRIPFPE